MFFENIINECINLAQKVNSKIKKKAITEASTERVNLTDRSVKSNVADLEDRFDQHLDAIGKVETIPVKQIIKLNNAGQMSELMKHCVVAVMPKLNNEDDDIAFLGAHNICTWSLTRHGMTNTSGRLTSKGMRRNNYHKKEEGGAAKSSKYAAFFNKIFPIGKAEEKKYLKDLESSIMQLKSVMRSVSDLKPSLSSKDSLSNKSLETMGDILMTLKDIEEINSEMIDKKVKAA